MGVLCTDRIYNFVYKKLCIFKLTIDALISSRSLYLVEVLMTDKVITFTVVFPEIRK